MLAVLAAGALGCSIEDGTAFGLPYTIAAKPAPFIEAGELIFEVTYKVRCPGDSSFEVSRFGEEHASEAPSILASSVMLVAARAHPTCTSPRPVERSITEVVRVPLPPSAQAPLGAKRFIACPPDSYYEMMALEEKVPGTTTPSFLGSGTPTDGGAKPADWDEEEDGEWKPFLGEAPVQAAEDDSSAFSDPVREAQRVVDELATHTPEDTVAFLSHCESKIAAGEPATCCSKIMVDALREKVAKDASVTAAAPLNASAEAAEVETMAVDASGASFVTAVGSN